MSADQPETAMTPAPAARPRTWPKVLLAVSLTMNLLVIGLIAGAHFRDGRDMAAFPPPDRNALRDAGVGPFFDALPRDSRGRMGQALRNGPGGGLGPDRAALAADLQAVQAALRADPYDPAALSAVLDAQQARVQARVDAGRAALLAEIARMTPAERAAFADRLAQGFQRGMNRAPFQQPAPPPAPATAQ